MKLLRSIGIIWQIFARDVKRLVKNPIAMIIVLGVLFLPSVYAWLTIGADWDPYGETGNLKVGFASADTGAENALVGKINIGAEVEEELKNDHHLGWQIVDEEQAKAGVWSGEYYAAIVIPADFSQDFLSVLNGDFTKPQIEYYVNEKISAVAPELTDSGARTVENEINAEFIDTVSKTVIGMVQQAGTEVKDEAEQAAGNLSADLRATEADVAQVSAAIDGFDGAAQSAKSAIGEAKEVISRLQQGVPQLSAGIAGVGEQLRGLNETNQAQAQKTEAGLTEAAQKLQEAAETVQGIAQKLETEGQEELAARVKELAGKLEQGSEQLDDLSGALATQITPNLTGALNQFTAATGTLQGAVNGMGPVLNSTEAALTQLDQTLDLAVTAGDSVQAALGAINQALTGAETDLAAIDSSAAVRKLSEFLGLNAEQIGEFMAAPVTLKTETVYPIKNYGTGVAPFFTNIALWVAGFILVAIFHLGVDPRGLPKFSVTETYWGRLLLFVCLGILQALIVCTGDLIMGIQCAEPGLYLLAGVVAVVVYVNIMYALVYTMRHIGRAIGVVILIMQIPGASGEYPVQMMPQFFQAIHPLLPFTYSIDAMREATGGLYGMQYWTDLLALVPFLLVALILGLALGRRAFNLNALFDRELSATGMLVTEPAGQLRQEFKLRKLVQTLLESRTYRKEVQKRAERFAQRYQGLVRLGWVLLIVIPLATLLINIVVPHDPETKVILLLLMVVGIIAACVYLIVVEFVNANLLKQLDLSAAQQRGLKAKNERKNRGGQSDVKGENKRKGRK